MAMSFVLYFLLLVVALKVKSLQKEILKNYSLCIDHILFNNIVILIRMVVVNVPLLWLWLKRDVTIKSKKFLMKPFEFLLEVFGVDAF